MIYVMFYNVEQIDYKIPGTNLSTFKLHVLTTLPFNIPNCH